MRLHTLTIEAFGAFAEPTVVDFDAVGADGLFAITGPTGAGKTTILDAVCFALYNRVPGRRQDAGQLRSHHAAPSMPSRVTLEFSASGKRYRISRTPSYERPKAHSSEMTTQPHKVEISEFKADGWAGLESTVTGVAGVVSGAIGLNAEQFTKLILLPQGDFAAFLHSDSDQRTDILQRLFGTQRFSRIEDVLESNAADARRDLDATFSHRKRLWDEADHLLWEHAPVADTKLPSAADVRAAYVSAASRVAEAHETARIVREIAADTAAAASFDAGEHAQRAGDAAVLAGLDEAEAAWNEEADERRTRAEALSAAERAADLESRVRAFRSASDRRDAARTAAAAAEQTSAQARRSAREVLGADLENLPTAELRSAASALIRRAEALAARSRAEAAVAAASESAAQARTASEEADIRLERARAGLADARSEVDLQRERLEATADADAALSDARRLRDALTAAEQARAHAESAQGRSAAAAAAAAEARSEVTVLRTGVAEQSAARLAADLIDGDPCPVCGSCTHPDPQRQKPTDVSEADLEAAERRAEAADRDDQAAQRAAAAAAERQRRADDDLGGLSEQDITTRLSAAESRVRERNEIREALESSRRSERAAAAELDAAQTASTERRDASARADSALSAATARAEAAADSIGDHDSSALAAAGITAADDEQSARVGAEALTRAADAADAAVEVTATLAQAEAVAQSAEQTLGGELERAGFSDLSAWHRASDVDLAGLRRRAEADAETRRRIDALAESPEALRGRAAGITAESADDLARDAAAAQQRADDASEHLKRAEEAHVRSSHILELTTAARRSAEGEIEKSEADIEINREKIALSALARGKGSSTSKISLSTYALIALFAEVAEAASARLRAMTKERFSFVHDTDAAKKERSAGLGLRIFDRNTDEMRDPRSLSGGESFMAALALALGLADTVAATSGGLTLDMLFLDEGFGSLDPDSLDEVLTVLDELRTGGRTIGVISHVPTMYEAITSQIAVRSTPTGSRVEHLVAGNRIAPRVGTGDA